MTVRLDVDPVTLPVQLATSCGLLINELVTNAYQHAFGDAASGLIEIRVHADEHVVTIVVRDNGRGLPRQAEEQESLGHGTEFTVRFPRSTSADPVDGGSGDPHAESDGDSD